MLKVTNISHLFSPWRCLRLLYIFLICMESSLCHTVLTYCSLSHAGMISNYFFLPLELDVRQNYPSATRVTIVNHSDNRTAFRAFMYLKQCYHLLYAIKLLQPFLQYICISIRTIHVIFPKIKCFSPSSSPLPHPASKKYSWSFIPSTLCYL